MDIAGVIGKAMLAMIKDNGNGFKLMDTVVEMDGNYTKRLYVIDGNDQSEDSKFMFSAFALMETENIQNGDEVYDYYMGINKDDTLKNFEANVYMWVGLKESLIQK